MRSTVKPSLLSQFLVRLRKDEFKLLFAICFLADGAEDYEDNFDLARYATPGWEQAPASRMWIEWLRRAARWVHFEYGFEFENLELKQNGSIRAKSDTIDPRNELLALGLAINKINYQDALSAALRMARERADLVGFPISALRAAAADVESGIHHARDSADPERLERFRTEVDDALASIGVVRRERVAVRQ